MSTAASARQKLKRAVNLGLTKPLVVLSAGVLFPVVAATTVGIVALALGQTSREFIFGILAVCFATAAVGSATVVVVLLGRRARTARMQSDLLGNVSHELKTPIAAIRMYAQTLQEEGAARDPAVVRRCADGIDRESHWLEAMVERLLAWRTVPRDRDALTLVVAPLGAAVADAARRFERMFVRGEVAFEVAIDSSLPVRHDAAAIGNIVLNLLTNAFKYTGRNKVIRLTLEDASEGVVLRVSDNGMGIPEADRRRIFEPFYRVEDPARAGAAGAGLGLAIVAALVQAHQGTIAVDSVVGEGTTFEVRLPRWEERK